MVIPAAANASIFAACTEDPISVNDPEPAAGKPNALTKNVAICSRVTGSVGQNIVLSGGLQPLVIPAAANASIFAACTEDPISVNDPEPAAGKPNALTKNVAICSRVTGSEGQNKSFTGGLQPLVIPAAANASIAGSCTEPLSSVNVPPGSSEAPASGAIENTAAATAAATTPRDNRFERIALPFHASDDTGED